MSSHTPYRKLSRSVRMLLGPHPLVQFKRGDHICVFYRDDNTLVQTLAAYLIAGLNNGERCFCAQKPRIIPRLRKALTQLGVNVEDAVSSGALQVHTEEEAYFPSGRFEREEMMRMLECSIEEAVVKGFTGFRTAGEMSWAIDLRTPAGGNYCDHLLEYESLVQAAYPGKPAIGLCQYPAHRFPTAILDQVLNAHRLALEETMVSSNHSTLTLRSGDYLADIVADRLNPSTAFHYVIQKRGLAEIVSWGVEPTIERAMLISESAMSDLNSNHSWTLNAVPPGR